MNARTALGLALCLLLTGCDDSTTPLSDPQTSKADERLVGVWQQNNGDVFYHIGHTDKTFPKGMMRVVMVTHHEAGVDPPDEYLAYSTVLGNKAYLNVVIDEEQVKVLNAKGWKTDVVKSYTFMKYQLDGDTLTVWTIDETAKQKAIESGKIKGVIEDYKPAMFTDTAENIARYIADAGDSLWITKEPGRLERVTTHQQESKRRLSKLKQQVDKHAAPTPPLRPLGNGLTVDKKRHCLYGKPVGIWGIDGRADSAKWSTTPPNYTGLTFSAHGPFLPWPSVKETF
jgi:hypothetical protein